MSNANPCSAGNGIAFPLYRAKISAPMGKDYLFGLIGELFASTTISNGSGRYGYKHTADITDSTGNQVARAYWGHKHPSATPCIDFVDISSGSSILSTFRTICKHTVTAITIEHQLSYLRFDQLSSMCCQSIAIDQGRPDRLVEVRDSTGGRMIKYSRDSVNVSIDSETCTLTISATPSKEFREMLTETPIRGVWSCSYWTRNLFDALFRQGDPLPANYSRLYPEPLRLNPESNIV